MWPCTFSCMCATGSLHATRIIIRVSRDRCLILSCHVLENPPNRATRTNGCCVGPERRGSSRKLFSSRVPPSVVTPQIRRGALEEKHPCFFSSGTRTPPSVPPLQGLFRPGKAGIPHRQHKTAMCFPSKGVGFSARLPTKLE